MRFAGVGIADIARLSVTDVRKWVQTLQVIGGMTTREGDIARDLVPEIKSRLEFLEEVGLGYLTLDRGAPTLSGGEAQRIRLAAQLGSNLQGVCYVLDEPTIGLHARDNKILLGALRSLSDKGNTLVVVEHDEETIRHADHIIDIGPSAGKRGGRLVAEGLGGGCAGCCGVADRTVLVACDEASVDGAAFGVGYRCGRSRHAGRLIRPRCGRQIGTRRTGFPADGVDGKGPKKPRGKAAKAAAVAAANAAASVAVNAEFLERERVAAIYGAAGDPRAGDDLAIAKQMSRSLPQVTRCGSLRNETIDWLTVNGANLHNLQNVTAHIPLKRLVAVTGVSGSGKSTLARDVLLTNVQVAVQERSTKAGRDALEAGEKIQWTGCEGVDGFETIDRVLEVDQTPIGKTPRSCPATYIGFWDTIRKLFADTLEAKARGYAANRFSFNTGEGRCPGCEGQGIRTIGMSFLPDVKVLCETCKGARFNPETQAVTWRGKNIGDVLQMEVDEAVDFFAAMPLLPTRCNC